jgi:hypothetical protein
MEPVYDSFCQRSLFNRLRPDNKILPPGALCAGWPCLWSLSAHVCDITVIPRRVSAVVTHMENLIPTVCRSLRIITAIVSVNNYRRRFIMYFRLYQFIYLMHI